MRRVAVGVAVLFGLAVAPASPAGAQPAGQSAQPSPSVQLPTSVENVREGLSREQVLRLEAPPVFRIEVTERRPRYWDMQSPFHFTFEPQAGGRWHDEFLSMTTPREVGMYTPMYSSADTAMVAATSLAFAGAASLVTAAFREWREARREGNARAAREEVDAALAAWEAANGQPR
jgi:hypothetical protein